MLGACVIAIRQLELGSLERVRGTETYPICFGPKPYRGVKKIDKVAELLAT